MRARPESVTTSVMTTPRIAGVRQAHPAASRTGLHRGLPTRGPDVIAHWYKCPTRYGRGSVGCVADEQAPAKSSDDPDAPSIKNMVPDVSDAPKGQVTMGDKAGAWGPWRAHQIMDTVASQIAAAVKSELTRAG